MWSNFDLSNLSGVLDTVNQFKDEVENQIEAAVTGYSAEDPQVVVGGEGSAVPSEQADAPMLFDNEGEEETWRCDTCSRPIPSSNSDLHKLRCLPAASAASAAAAPAGSSVLDLHKQEPAPRVDQGEAPGAKGDSMAQRSETETEGQAELSSSGNDLAAVGSQGELVKELRLALKERERQLETMSLSAASATVIMRSEGGGGSAEQVAKLKAALAEEQDKCRALRREKMEWAEKEGMLAAYKEEGEALSLKQSEMEKLVRRSREELRGITEERDKLKEGKVGADARIKELTEQNKALQRKSEAEVKELRRVVGESESAISSLRSKLAQEGSLATTTESVKKEWAEREDKLTSQVQQLEESLLVAQNDAGTQQDALKAELQSMRQRWQDAVSRNESFESDMQLASAPLLKQVRVLQEELRRKHDSQVEMESALAERVAAAEARVKTEREARMAAETECSALRMAAGQAEDEGRALQDEVERVRASCRAANVREASSLERTSQAEAELTAARDQLQHVAAEAKVMEDQLKLQVAAARERAVSAKAAAETTVLELKGKLGQAIVELDEEKRLKQEMEARITRSASLAAMEIGSPASSRGNAWGEDSVFSRSDGLVSGQQLGLSGDNASYAALEQLKGSTRRAERELDHLHQQLAEAETTRKALMKEVDQLGQRNMELEGYARDGPGLLQRAQQLGQQNEVLLELLGEKEEDLALLNVEMDEVKESYRMQLESLLGGGEPPS
ncbi:unnamed protein product [Chrysoparadoxa australica]